MDPDQLKPLPHRYGSFPLDTERLVARRSTQLGTALKSKLAFLLTTVVLVKQSGRTSAG